MTSPKARCDALNILVALKFFTEKELETLVLSLKTSIEKQVKPVKFLAYYRWILQKTLIDPDAFFEFIKKDTIILSEGSEEEKKAIAEGIVQSMYQGVTEVYPILDIDLILREYNRRLIPHSVVATETEVKIVKNKDSKKQEVLDAKALKELHKTLKTKLLGQDHAIDAVCKAIKQKAAGLCKFSSLFFVGPTGVGKTELAKILASFLGNRFIKINCGEMSHGHEHQKYIGAPPGYVGHTEDSFLKSKAEESSQWVFLFDEIEKASPKFFDFLLSLLDDGTLIDNVGKTLDFSDSIFIFTSNEGIDKINYNGVGFSNKSVDKTDYLEVIKKALESRFRLEFINRIDEIVFFNFLTKEDIEKIIKLELEKFPIVPTSNIILYILQNGYSEKFGVRNIKRFIKSNITPILADVILSSENKNLRYIPILENNTLTFRSISNELDGEVESQERRAQGTKKTRKARAKS